MRDARGQLLRTSFSSWPATLGGNLAIIYMSDSSIWFLPFTEKSKGMEEVKRLQRGEKMGTWVRDGEGMQAQSHVKVKLVMARVAMKKERGRDSEKEFPI